MTTWLSMGALGLCLLSLVATGCASNQTSSSHTAAKTAGPYGVTSTPRQNKAAKSQSTTDQSTASGGQWPAGKVIAYVSGQPVSAGQMFPLLLNYAGGQVLSGMILDQQIDRKLSQRGMIISPDMIEAERQYLLDALSSDPDQAVRLLKQMRDSRGVTNERFNQTLRRNAALRALSKDQVNVTDLDLRQAFTIEHGEKFEARVITTQSLNEIQKLLAQLNGGASFVDLAVAHSTDPSRDQGGLLPPISDVDASYPAAIRQMLVGLKPGQVSHPIALDNGYAILKLERKIQGDQVKFDDIKQTLMLSVQRQQQQTRMRLLARTLLEEADVVVLDPVLKESWDRQKQLMDQTP